MSYSYGKSIVTDGLVFYVDAANENSYPGSGTTWSELVGRKEGTIREGPGLSSRTAGIFQEEGTHD